MTENNIKTYQSFSGSVMQAMPKLIAANMELGNYYSLGITRMQHYATTHDAKAPKRLDWFFNLPGNPVIAHKNYGDIIIVSDLNTADLAPLKNSIQNINNHTLLNEYDSVPIDNKLYEQIRNSPGSIVLEERIVQSLKQFPHAKKKERMHLFSQLFHQDEQMNAYHAFIKEWNESSYDKTKIMGFYIGEPFDGMRFLGISPAEEGSDITIFSLTSTFGRLFGVKYDKDKTT
jgi:hypothetical protein